MSAPSATARQTPAGVMLRNGFKSVVTFSSRPTIAFWEKSVKPSSFDNGEKIDQTTMFNVRARTFGPRALYESGDITGKAAYDPEVRNQIRDMVGIEQTITVTYSDGSTDAAYGFLKMVDFDEMVNGTQPDLSFTICVTNYDPAGHAEAQPVMLSESGT